MLIKSPIQQVINIELVSQGVKVPFPGCAFVQEHGQLLAFLLGQFPIGYPYINFQIAVLAALQMYIPNAAQSERAAVFIFALYVVQTGLTILFGAGGALALKRRPVVKRTRKN